MKYLYKLTFFAIFVVIISGCGLKGDEEIPSAVKGFESFPSARDFDPPGRIYRITQEGVLWPVGLLDIKVYEGEEHTLSFKTKSNWSLSGLFKTIGVVKEVAPEELQQDLTKDFTVELRSVTGLREYLEDDSGIYPALFNFFKTRRYREDDDYYLIRETISTKELHFTTGKSWQLNFTANAKIKKIIDANSKVEFGNDGSISLIKKFEKPLRVWFKAEKITRKDVFGIGPSGANAFELQEFKAGELNLGIEEMEENP